MQATQPSVALLKADSSNTGWRTVCFHLPWQQKQEPDWSIGTQIAGEIIAPVLAQRHLNINYWRFHRRAVEDATGHTFSFIVYSSAASAEKIYADIKASPNTIALKKTGQITRIEFDPLDKNPKPEIKDTSDPVWPAAIQKTWPGFIMGASQMWLDLILQLKTESPSNANQRERYQSIHQHITKLWEQHGQHAWLHHLNALYGYSPIAIHF
ncbi:MAG: hypothetical protein HOP02_14585 [Methylococcaceae bacterium]|nr:hypothetical protein [Methylococcaceae bacterium]